MKEEFDESVFLFRHYLIFVQTFKEINVGIIWHFQQINQKAAMPAEIFVYFSNVHFVSVQTSFL